LSGVSPDKKEVELSLSIVLSKKLLFLSRKSGFAASCPSAASRGATPTGLFRFWEIH
jgi:hypothetical protein